MLIRCSFSLFSVISFIGTKRIPSITEILILSGLCGFSSSLTKEIKRNGLKGPAFNIRYWRISVTLGSVLAGCKYISFMCTSVSGSLFGRKKT